MFEERLGDLCDRDFTLDVFLLQRLRKKFLVLHEAQTRPDFEPNAC